MGLWGLVQLVVPQFLSVQTEVLGEEDNIKEDSEDAKSELGWVSEDQHPLVCQEPEGTESVFRLAVAGWGWEM